MVFMDTINFCNFHEQETRNREVTEKIEQWIYSDALKRILATFGVTMPVYSNLRDAIGWLLQFSDEWDYRGKQHLARDKKTNEAARWLVNDEVITDEQDKAVKEGIPLLGLIGIDTPFGKDYDYVIALGGARLSCLLRPRYAQQVIEQYSINPKAVIMLSGFRPIGDSEREATDTYAKNAVSEYDLICAGAEKCFDLEQFKEERYDSENLNLSWAVRVYEGVPPVICISAPSTEPDKRRANSADTYKFFFEKYDVKENTKILLVTSQIYVPYQQLEAIRTLSLPYGVKMETIGFPNEWSGNMQGMQQASNYLQEIRSTIQAMDRFLKAIEV